MTYHDHADRCPSNSAKQQVTLVYASTNIKYSEEFESVIRSCSDRTEQMLHLSADRISVYLNLPRMLFVCTDQSGIYTQIPHCSCDATVLRVFSSNKKLQQGCRLNKVVDVYNNRTAVDDESNFPIGEQMASAQ